MSAARKKRRASRARRPATTRPSESFVYDGSKLLGTLVERGHVFTARNAEGRRIAKFSTLKDAMSALANAGRALAKPSETSNPAPSRAAKR